MKKSVFVILLVFFISAFSISMYFVVKETIEDKKQYEVFENIVSSVQVEDDSSDYTDEKLKRYIELNTENSDFVGWIKIDGTHINYPVMKSSTPDYYLHRNFNKEYSYYGTPYLSDKSDTMNPTDNIVIYYHNMRDNTMFGDLSKYKSKEFYEKHRYIHFDTLVDLGKYEIVCVFKPHRANSIIRIIPSLILPMNLIRIFQNAKKANTTIPMYRAATVIS